MPELKALYQPGTLAEAQALLEQYGERARPLAGGTSLALSRSSKVDVLVDLSRTGLDGIRLDEDGLHVGAMATCAGLRRFLSRKPLAGGEALGDAAGSVGSRILQNHVTVGGNCVMVYAWSDLPVALLALEGEFVIQGRGRTKKLEAEGLFSAHPTRSLAEGELLVEVIVPATGAGGASAHLKHCRNAVDQALASASVRLELRDGVVRSARVAVGAVRGLPQLLTETSAGLVGKEPDPQSLALAGAAAGREAKVSSDFKASGDFRTQLVAVLVEDALQLAVSRAEEQTG
jgi:CO/xanthine dehydrogenase FAD-binding subunit